MAIGVLGLDDNDIAKKISNNAFTVISGLANFKDGVVADSITTDDLNASSQIVVKGEESWYSEDENAALVVQGGASIQK
jgi:predicted Rossmann fold nucleotide-binding protein DprA/Smf involved in DNA uptake